MNSNRFSGFDKENVPSNFTFGIRHFNSQQCPGSVRKGEMRVHEHVALRELSIKKKRASWEEFRRRKASPEAASPTTEPQLLRATASPPS